MSESWRQYGGTRKQNTFHNLTIGTLVADQLLLRESYAGKYIIPGTIYVGADVEAIGNIYARTNLNTDFDLFVGKNTYITNKLMFGSTDPILDSNTTHTYMYGDACGNVIGMNTMNPRTVFDINGSRTSQIDILTVRSMNTNIRNVIAENVNRHGLAITANDALANVDFFIDTSNNSSNIPDARIQYLTGGNMSYSSSNNTMNSTYGNTTLTSSGATYINSGTLLNITTGQTATLSSQSTKLLSTLSISNRGTPLQIFNENTVIYDISSGFYLYDAYENTGAFAGSAATLVANSSAANTFLRIVTPNKMGLSIGAGSYPNDQSRSLGTIGLTDNSGNYKVNQTIVSGNSLNKYYSTTGINTYAPRTENYVMDINGPTHISNGEINKMSEVNSEINNVSFSSISPGYGIAVGSASTLIAGTTNTYPQYVSITNNGGLSWTLSRIDTISNLESTSKYFNVFVYDSNYAIIGSSNNFLYYTKNGGLTWWIFGFSDPINSIIIRSTITLYVGEFNSNTKRAFLVYNTTSRPEMQIVYFNIDFTQLPNQNYYKIVTFTTISPSITTIRKSGGYGDYVYFVGTGIQKYQISTATSQYSINTGLYYYDITFYNANFAIAVGTNVISYTNDGTNWTNIDTTSTSIGFINLKSVNIFNLLNAVAVGDNGMFIYTNDGGVTWNVVPNSILNTSGYAARINGTSNQLRNVYMNDVNSMTISCTKQGYIVTNVGGKAVITQGLSKIYNCYIPNLFNRANNGVFDVSGNMIISGDINVNDGGNIATNNSTFNLINTTAQTVNFAGNATTIYMGNSSNVGTTYLQQQLTTFGDVSLNRRLFVGSDSSLNGNFYVGKKSILNGDVSMNGGFSVAQDSDFVGNLWVHGFLKVDMDWEYINDLIVTGYAKLNDIVYTRGDVSMTGNLYVDSRNIDGSVNPKGGFATFNCDTSINQRLYVGNDVSFGGKLSVMKDISTNGNLTFYTPKSRMTVNSEKITVSDGSVNQSYYDVSTSKLIFIKDLSENAQTRLTNLIHRTQYINSNTNDANTMMQMNKSTNQILLYGSLVPAPGQKISLGSATSHFDSLYVNTNTIYFSGAAGTQASLSFNQATGGLDVGTGATLNGSTVLSYDGKVAIGKTDPVTPLDVLGISTFNGDINQQTGNTYIGANLSVSTDSSFNGNVSIGGNTIQNGNVTVKSKLFVNSDVSLNNSKLYVSSDATFNSRVYITSDLSLNQKLYVNEISIQNGDVSANSRLFVNGDTSLNSQLYVQNKTVLNGDVSANGNLNLNGYASIKSDVSLNSRLYIGSDVSINGRLFVKKTATFADIVAMNSELYVIGDVSLNGNVHIAGLTINDSDVSMNGNLYLNEDAFIGGDLSVNGLAKFNSDVSLNKRLFVNGTTIQNGDITMNSHLFVLDDTSLNGNLYVTGITTNASDVQMNGNITVIQNASVGGNLLINGDKTILNTDVSLNGKLFVSGSTIQNGNVILNNNLYVSGQTVNAMDVSINGNLSIGGETGVLTDLYVGGKTIQIGDVSMNANLIIGGKTILSGDTTLNSRLFVTKDTSLNGNLLVTGIMTNTGNVTMNSRLFVANQANFGNNITVSGGATVNQSLNVIGDVSINGRLFVTTYGVGSIPLSAIVGGSGLGIGSFANDVNIGKNFYVGGDTILYGNVTVIKDLTIIGNIRIQQYTVNQVITTVNYQLMIAEDLSVNGNLYMTGDASINSHLFLGDDASLNANLYVAGNSTFANPVFMNNNVTIGGQLNINGSIAMSGLTVFNGDASMNANLKVGGVTTNVNDVSMNARLFVGRDASFNSKLFVLGQTTNQNDVSMNARLFVGRDASFNSKLFVLGQTINQDDVSMNARLFVNNDTSLNANLYVNNFSTFNNVVTLNNRLIVNNDSTLSANLFVYGTSILNNAVTMNNILLLNGDTSSNANLYVGGNTTLNGRLYVNGDLSLNSRLFVKGLTINQNDVSMNGRLFVGKDASFNSNLYVLGKTTLQNDVSLNSFLYGRDASFTGNIAIYGNLFINTDLKFDALFVKKDTTMNGNVYITGVNTEMVDCSINGNIFVGLDTSLNGKLFVGGDVYLNSNVNIVGELTTNTPNLSENSTIVATTEYVKNQLSSLTSSASFSGDVIMTNRLFLYQDASFSGNFYAEKHTILAGDVSINSNLNVASDVSIAGNIFISNNIAFNGIVTQF